MESRELLATFTVTNTADSGAGSLRSAMLSANATPGANFIEFSIPASRAADLSVPVAGFDPNSQTWKITLQSPLPMITNPLTIDGFSQGASPVPYRYLNQLTTIPLGDPVLITSKSSTLAAKSGDDAIARLIIDGSGTGGATGLVVNASHSVVRGLVLTGFGVGVSVPNPGTTGDLIQGNDIGKYFLFFVDPNSGAPLSSGAVGFAGPGNSLQGVLIGSTNVTVGGVNTQDANVIVGNGLQGVSILAGADGNQVIGNQIGIAGPTSSGRFVIAPNGADGVLIASSSNSVGGPASGAGNLISGNKGNGVHIVGVGTTRNDVQGNYVGIGPAGGFLFGTGNPGNVGDGVQIEDASDSVIGGAAAADQNVISANGGAGVRIFGSSAVRNQILGNQIGITSNGTSALGNQQEGVAIYSPNNIIGPKNVISANLRGILLSGLGATGDQIQGNLIGTDNAGIADLGNANEGVRIDGASGNQLIGDGMGSQVISGNNVGVLIIGGSSGNLVAGSFIGTDMTGKFDLGNSQEGVRIENSPGNTIGGSSVAARDLISANHWGVVITGAQATGNDLQGSFIGTDISGAAALSNELDGVLIENTASGNLIGGPGSSGNSIAFNRRDGVRVQDASIANAILSNSIFANLGRGIDLFVPGGLITPGSGPNLGLLPPVLTAVASLTGATNVQGQVNGAASTDYLVQFFASSPLDPTGTDEGGQFLGESRVTTDPTGSASFSSTFPISLKPGQFVTATQTSLDGNTSDFSAPLAESFGSVQFLMSSYTVNEAGGTATIEASRIGGSGGAFSVNYSTADGTAQAGTDYTASSGTINFGLDQTIQTFTVPILDNGLPAPDKTLQLILSNPAGSVVLGAIPSASLTILGNKAGGAGTVQFQMASTTVTQGAGTATIVATRTGGGGQAFFVNYGTIDGSAVAGVDYTATSGTLAFGVGQTTATFTVPILSNGLASPYKTLQLTLSNPTGAAVLGPISTEALTIVRNKAGALQFSMADYFVAEAGVAAFITVSRNITDTAVSVNYSTADGTAKAGTDYTPTSGTLTFNAGQSVATFAVPILINPRILGNETINLGLSAPTGGATLTAPSTAVLVIIDDFVNRMGPHVTSVSAVSGAAGVAGVSIRFDEPIDPIRAVNLLNYGYSVRIAGHDGRLGTRDDQLIGVRSASYDPVTQSVSLVLAQAVAKNMPLEVMINQATDVPIAGVGVSDLSGNLLDGNSDGLPGGSYSVKIIAKQPPPTHRIVPPKKGHAVKPKVVAKAVPGHVQHPSARHR